MLCFVPQPKPTRNAILSFLKKINKTDWRFHLEPPMEEPEKVIRYIGRYSKRACLSERKITEIDNEYISFEYKDYRDRQPDKKPKIKILRLHYSEFFPRLLQHVPLAHFQIIRYYGLYANSCKIKESYTQKPEGKNRAATAYKNPKHCEYCHVYKEFLTDIDTAQMLGVRLH